MGSCSPNQDAMMVHCIFASRQNTRNCVVPTFYFLMIVFNAFCLLNWKCPWFFV